MEGKELCNDQSLRFLEFLIWRVLGAMSIFISNFDKILETKKIEN
jgi:hypothetical protein